MQITPDMTIAQVLQAKPEAAEIFMSHGSHCLTCPQTGRKTVADMAQKHQVSLEKLLRELNGVFS